ncbi:B9 domain-containing protein 2 [Borealophlyctis nickersoniae]|nr:B9 domain-containing protein 2 [Borealophlyctis nickersoniae]
MAEVHVIGTLLGASGFPRPELCCKWALVAGDGWKVLEGDVEGRTQVDLPQKETNNDYTTPFNPKTFTMQQEQFKDGPNSKSKYFTRIVSDGTNYMATVSSTFLRYQAHTPSSASLGGLRGASWIRFAYFLGATPQLRNLDIIHTPTDRFRLTTEAMGKVHLEVGVVVRNFEKYGVAL